jgi:hypothetical protein
VLNAVYDLLTSATIWDGSARSAKVTGVTKDGSTNAVYGSWVSSTISGLKWIVSNDTGVTFRPPDDGGGADLVTNLVKNAGAYSNYASATPFGGGAFEFDNYMLGAGSSVITSVGGCESDEGVVVWVTGNTTGLVWWNLFGALWDPNSTSALDGEYPDGSGFRRRVGQITAGVSASGIEGYAPGAGWTYTTTAFSSATGPFNHSTAANNCHVAVMSIGGEAVEVCARATMPTAAAAAISFLPSGKLAVMGDIIHHTQSANVIGRAREMAYINNAVHGETFQSAGVDIFHVLGGQHLSTSTAIALKAS